MADSFDVIVIGLGVMGSATCHHLAQRGARVLGLEQFEVPHARGSSHGSTRLYRQAYFEHPDYVPLLLRAFELWKELERQSGQELFPVAGGIYIGKADDPLVVGSLEAARRHGLAHEMLDRNEIARRFPQFRLPDGYVGFWEDNAGFLLADRIVIAQCRLAMERRAELHANEPVVQWSADETGVSVKTPKGTYSAGHLVFCGGPWTGKLLRDLDVELVVTRQVLGWFWPREPKRFEIGRFPCWAIGHADGTLHYGFPMFPGEPGLKAALHAPATVTDPDHVDRTPRPEDEAQIRAALERFLPEADGNLMGLRFCLYTNSPDGHFVLDRHPRHPRVSVACGFSGHGFKFGSVVGQVMADLALEGRTDLPARFLSLERFGHGGAAD